MSLTPLAERTLPWSPFGKIFHTDENLSTYEMLSRAGLVGWDVQVEPIPLPDNYWTDKDLFWTTRASGVNPVGRDIFGTVGSRYHPSQNEEIFAFGDALLDGGKWASAGSFKNGRVVFGTLKLDGYTNINGAPIDMYLLVSTSHDGSLAVVCAVTPINPSCWNTLIAAIAGAEQKWSFRHTASLAGRLQNARESLDLSHTYVDLWAEFMRPLADTEVTDIRFDEIINAEFKPADDASKSALTRWDKRYELLNDIWYGPTIKDTPFANTQFAVWNALNEAHGWAQQGRGDNAAENVAASRSGFNPIWNAENNRLLTIAQSA